MPRPTRARTSRSRGREVGRAGSSAPLSVAGRGSGGGSGRRTNASISRPVTCGREQGLAVGDDAYGVDQRHRLDVLEQEAGRAGAQRAEDVLVELEGGQHQDPGPGQGRVRRDLGGGLEPVEPRHPDVHQHHVGPGLGASATASRPSTASPTTSMSSSESSSARKPGADQRLVVGQQHPDRSRRAAGTGRRRQHPPAAAGRGPASSVPPGGLARARACRGRRCPVPRCGRSRRTVDDAPAVVADVDDDPVVLARDPHLRARAAARAGPRWSAPPARSGSRSSSTDAGRVAVAGSMSTSTSTPADREARPARRGRRARASPWVGPHRRAASSSSGERSVPSVARRSASASPLTFLMSCERPAGLLGVAVEQVRADAGLHVDRDHRVRDHVVHVAGDPQPLLADPAQRLLLAGALGRLGPLDQRGVGGAALADRRAEQQGRGDEREVLGDLRGPEQHVVVAEERDRRDDRRAPAPARR